MTVRKTESRIPANFQASDLGEASVAADGRCALTSFVTSPLVVSVRQRLFRGELQRRADENNRERELTGLSGTLVHYSDIPARSSVGDGDVRGERHYTKLSLRDKIKDFSSFRFITWLRGIGPVTEDQKKALIKKLGAESNKAFDSHYSGANRKWFVGKIIDV